MLFNLIGTLRNANLIIQHQEESLIEQVNASGISIPEALVNSGIFTSRELATHLSSIFGLPYEPLSNYDYSALCQKLGLRELITSHHALPLERTPSTLTLAIADPTNQQAEDDFRFATGLQIDLVITDFRSLMLRFAVCTVAR